MKTTLVELALRKERLQMRSAQHRQALVRNAQIFTPVFRGVDRVVDGVLWARNNAPILSGAALFLLVVRPRAALRWARRGWVGWQLLRRVNKLVS